MIRAITRCKHPGSFSNLRSSISLSYDWLRRVENISASAPPATKLERPRIPPGDWADNGTANFGSGGESVETLGGLLQKRLAGLGLMV